VSTPSTAILITKDITLEVARRCLHLQCTAVLFAIRGHEVILSGGVQAKNVIWQNAGNVIQPRAFMQGIILCKTDVAAIETGASVNGAIMAQTAVALRRRRSNLLTACVVDRLKSLPLPLENLPLVPVAVSVSCILLGFLVQSKAAQHQNCCQLRCPV
jgi:hypothetical protein